MFVSRQEGLRPEEPKTLGLSSAAGTLAAFELEVTQVWKRLLPWLLPLSGIGNLRRVETFMSHYFWTTEGKVGLCYVRLKILKAANMKTFWQRDANCVVESCPLWTHPTVITYRCQDGSKRTEQQRGKRIYIKKAIKRRAGQRRLWESCSLCEGSL